MGLLIVGLIIWTAAHLFRSCAKGVRESMQKRLGSASKGLMAVIILGSLALMIIGHRSANATLIWSPQVWMTYINNALMFVALYIYLTTATKPGTAFIFGSLKHPQLVGFKIWAFAHLLVNGDLASVVLFGGLLLWAVLQVIVSNKSESLVDRATAPITSKWIHLVLVVSVFILVVFIHNSLGVRPFS